MTEKMPETIWITEYYGEYEADDKRMVGNNTECHHHSIADQLAGALSAVMTLRSVETLFEAAIEYPHDKEDVQSEIDALNGATEALAQYRRLK